MPTKPKGRRPFYGLFLCARDCLATGIVCAAVLMVLVRLLN